MGRRSEKWIGGFVRRNKDGRATYVIHRRINGRLYEVSTRASTERAAMRELDRFETDPEGYKPGGPTRPEAVLLTPELIEKFLDWSARPEAEGGKGNSPRHVYYQSDYLYWWRDQLGDLDLRNLDLRYLEGPLQGTPSRRNKLIAIKAFYGWLVGVERLLSPTEDPTYRRLKVPRPKAAQTTKIKAITAEEYRETREKLEALTQEKNRAGKPRFNPYWLDALDVLAGTGWHVTELERFSETGEILESKEGPILQTIHKSGSVHKTLVSPLVGEAATRIRKRTLEAKGPRNGPFRAESLNTALQRACDYLGIPRLNPGSFRHSIATHAINQGANLEATSDFLGHRSPETTRKFYATHAVPKKVPTFI